MNLQLTLLIVYSLGVIGLGLWTSRLIHGSGDFFVAGRRLGSRPDLRHDDRGKTSARARRWAPQASRIAKGSAPGWCGSDRPASESIVFALVGGPAPLARRDRAQLLHRQATTSSSATASGCEGSPCRSSVLDRLRWLAGQLIAGAAILNVITGAPRWVGALVGGGVDDDLLHTRAGCSDRRG